MKTIFSLLLAAACFFPALDAQVFTFFPLPDTLEASAVNITVFPNPTTDRLVLSSPADMDTIALFDSAGRLCYFNQSGRTVQKLDMSAYPAGMYWVMVNVPGYPPCWKKVQKV
ncbi:MAG: T9SS type A sorting domain-containing protein [Saprospiraceae bacterium]